MTSAPLTRSEAEACLLRYTRAIDRLDADLLLSAFFPGAELEGYGRPGATTIEAFAERALPSLRDGYRTTQHRLSNVTVMSHDGYATVESYVLALHVRDNPDDPDGADQLLTFNGRYIDRFEHRDGEWRIARRQLLADWTRVDTIEEPMRGAYVMGQRDASDASYD